MPMMKSNSFWPPKENETGWNAPTQRSPCCTTASSGCTGKRFPPNMNAMSSSASHGTCQMLDEPAPAVCVSCAPGTDE